MSLTIDMRAIKHSESMRTAAGGKWSIPFKELIRGFSLREVSCLAGREKGLRCRCDLEISHLNVGLKYKDLETVVWMGEDCLRHFVSTYGVMESTLEFLEQVKQLMGHNFEMVSTAVMTYGFAKRVLGEADTAEYLKRDEAIIAAVNRRVFLDAMASLIAVEEYTGAHPDKATGSRLIDEAGYLGRLTSDEVLEYKGYLSSLLLSPNKLARVRILNRKILAPTGK